MYAKFDFSRSYLYSLINFAQFGANKSDKAKTYWAVLLDSIDCVVLSEVLKIY